MGHRITQRIHECSYCGRIPEDGEYMWYMGKKIMCQTCNDNDVGGDEEVTEN